MPVINWSDFEPSKAELEIVFEEIRSRVGYFVKLCYVDAADDLIAGVLLSQIIFWFLPNPDTGQLKTHVLKHGRRWIAKKRTVWYEEIRITPKQYDRAIGVLESRGLVITKVWKFGSTNEVHITVCWDVLKARLIADGVALTAALGDRQRVICELTKGEVGSADGEGATSSSVNSQVDQTDDSYTESTSEPTSESSDKLYPGAEASTVQGGSQEMEEEAAVEAIEGHAQTFFRLLKTSTSQGSTQGLFEKAVPPKLQQRVIARIEQLRAAEEEEAARAAEPEPQGLRLADATQEEEAVKT
jgi:hypothetical protein